MNQRSSRPLELVAHMPYWLHKGHFERAWLQPCRKACIDTGLYRLRKNCTEGARSVRARLQSCRTCCKSSSALAAEGWFSSPRRLLPHPVSPLRGVSSSAIGFMQPGRSPFPKQTGRVLKLIARHLLRRSVCLAILSILAAGSYAAPQSAQQPSTRAARCIRRRVHRSGKSGRWIQRLRARR